VSEPAHPDGDAESPTRLARALDAQPGCTVVVCGGLVCSTSPNDQTENLRQLGRVIARSSGGVLIRSLGCLGPCRRAPVVTVTGRLGPCAREERARTDWRRPAGITVWTTLTETGQLDRLKAWIEAGGPGVAPLPDELDSAVIAIL
jgi:hypothetical protein